MDSEKENNLEKITKKEAPQEPKTSIQILNGVAYLVTDYTKELQEAREILKRANCFSFYEIIKKFFE